uniref:Transcription-initiator DNA-binding domain IBD n=1 Tax=Podoviridae sp. ctrTt13 TaxID=2825279 RepID=A0A8S5NTQ5_9CAUD|nr:MAG TPA: Transcription-initiator DNA-binding domain IBD [Podoviridae sp. ctrTt13]
MEVTAIRKNRRMCGIIWDFQVNSVKFAALFSKCL